MTKRKPNIILINCDDLGYGDLGCYGSPINKTPVIDRMAKEGIKFTSFYMASPVCSPSRGAMMTGCYPKRIGFGDFDGSRVLFPGHGVGLNPEEITIAKLLKDSGYKTMLIGKWHCGDQPEFLPTRHGFDSYYGLPYSNDMGRQVGREDSPPLPLMLGEEVIQEQPDQASLTERYVEQAVRFIRENKEEPFFLYFSHMYVHLPLFAPQRFLDQSENGPYGAAVEGIDWAAGVFMDELKKQGIYEDTLVIFTSDNGSKGVNGGSNRPLRGEKGSTWEGGMRVPCIMWWPGKIQGGVVCNEIISSIDFYPTLAKIAGCKVPKDRKIDGIDIRQFIFNGNGGEGDKWDKSLREAFYYYNGNNLEAVRSGKWKLHIRKGEEGIKELYDLDSDIGESKNLWNKHPHIAAQLQELLQKARVDLGDDAEGIEGKNTRPIGRVDNPVTLTKYDPEHPYMVAMYDGPIG